MIVYIRHTLLKRWNKDVYLSQLICPISLCVCEGRNSSFLFLSKKRVGKWRKQEYETQKNLLCTKNMHLTYFARNISDFAKEQNLWKNLVFCSNIYTLKGCGLDFLR